MNSKLVNVALWSVAVLVAAGAGTAAVAATAAPSGRPVLSQQDVDRQLSTTPSQSPTAGVPTPGVPTDAGGPAQSLFAAAGTIVVSCDGNVVTLLRWAPATGFHAEDTISGPADIVTVKFESDSSEVRTSATCINGVASLTTNVDRDHHGNGGPTSTGGPAPTPSPTGDDNGGGHGDGHGDGGGGNDGNGGGHGDGGGHGSDDPPGDN